LSSYVDFTDARTHSTPNCVEVSDRSVFVRPAKNTRGDKTAIEPFLDGVRGWEAGLRRSMDGGKSTLE
jgi:hypothetical protein